MIKLVGVIRKTKILKYKLTNYDYIKRQFYYIS